MKIKARKKLSQKIRRVELLLFDVDGVLTDGGLYLAADGGELKRFDSQDGYGLVRAREAGLRLALISGRASPVVEARARELKIPDVLQGVIDKLAALEGLLQKHGLTAEQAAYMGDDLIDLPLLRAVGLSAAPADARKEVRRAVDYVTRANGGRGAAREWIELILKQQRPRGVPPRDRTDAAA